jgi:hypothetical protein
MGRRARIQFASLKSSLVNLPLSFYGPLVERQVVSDTTTVFLQALNISLLYRGSMQLYINTSSTCSDLSTSG